MSFRADFHKQIMNLSASSFVIGSAQANVEQLHLPAAAFQAP